QFLPDWIRRKVRHSFLHHPEHLEKIHLENFYTAFSEATQEQLLDDSLIDELRDVSPYATSMPYLGRRQSNGDLLDKLLYLDIKTYLLELLMKQDQMSMAVSIESRVPFLDHKLVEWAFRLPRQYKVRGFSGKYLLRKAMASRLPSAVIKGNKKGFPTPIRPWLQHELFAQLSTVLTDGRLQERRLFKPEYVQRLLSAHRAGFSEATEQCWRLLTFELWCRIFVDRDATTFETSRSDMEAAVYAA